MSEKVVGGDAVTVVRNWVEGKLGDTSTQNDAVVAAINALSDKPLNGAGLAVLRDWINARIDSIPTGPDLDESTADATAVASDISDGKTAYVKGVKVTGTLPDVVGVNLYQSGSILSGIGDIPNGSGGSDFVNRTTIAGTMTDDRILREGARVSIVTASSLFGDADPSDVLAGKTFTAKDGKETGTIAIKSASDLTASGPTVSVPAGYYPSQATKSVDTATQATPSISIDKTTGLVTASATQTAGYVSDGTKSGTLQLTTQAAATITPGTAAKTAVAADRYATGAVTVEGDPDLVAGNIKSGVSIFGVTGTVQEGVNTSDATATASDIASGKTAYVNGSKVTGDVDVISSTRYLGNSSVNAYGSNVRMIGYFTSDKIVKANVNICITRSYSDFGDATAADVAYGKTFTGADGFKVGGTLRQIVAGATNTYNADDGVATCEVSDGVISVKVITPSDILFRDEARQVIKVYANAIGAGKSWTVSALSSSANWYSVAYGGGKFVSVAISSNKAAYSSDGITWTASTLSSSADWVSITYGRGKFVAVTNTSNKAAYSSDGITWTASTLPSSAGWHSVTYGEGKFVIAANGSNNAAYSSDGITWTASKLPSNANWYSITYGEGKFVAVAYGSNNAAYSSDGITWTASTLPSSANWYSITYGRGKFVAVAYGSNKAAYSSDGITWTASTLPSSANWQSITYGGGKFVAVAYGSNKAAYSSDGITWTASTLPVSSKWQSITYGGGKFVVVVYNSNAAVYSSEI